MKTIKTRNTVKNIKVLDKTVNLSKRMKEAYVRTKDKAEETQSAHHATPAEYASENIQGTAQGAARDTAYYFSNPRQKARDNWTRAKGHFQEVRRQTPKERNRAAEQAQKTAHKAKSNAENLRKTADKAGETAQDAQTAVGDAKQRLKEVRQQGRRTLREVKQKARIERGGVPDMPSGQSTVIPARGGATPQKAQSPPATADISRGGISRPSYMNKGVNAPKSAGDTAKTLQLSVKSTGKAVESTRKGFKETAKGTVKTAKKSVKTAEQSAKAAVKTAQRTAKTAQKTANTAAKTAKAAERAARAAAKTAAKTAKAVTKAVAAMVKAAIAAVKGLIAVIAAGGWVAVLVILIICLIGLLVGSIFGIFFSSEPSESGKTINGVIAEIDTEYTDTIDGIIAANAHDLLDMSGARASWKEVLAVYTVKTVNDPDNPMEVATIDDEKAALLRSVFWEMNVISHTLDSTSVEEDVLDDDGLPTGETTTVTTTVLRIVVSHKTPLEMAALYGFNDEQTAQLEELLKPDYHYLWNALLYGITSVGDGSMIGVAETQLGNVGGEPYWSWYGFTSRVEWCACFVSWVAEQCGYIDAGIIPKFAWCPTGVQWFKDRGQWCEPGYVPAPGDIIFFDWENDGECDHVGIVESVADGMVNTIEGNSSDSCRRRSYEIDSIKIYGYGVPAY